VGYLEVLQLNRSIPTQLTHKCNAKVHRARNRTVIKIAITDAYRARPLCVHCRSVFSQPCLVTVNTSGWISGHQLKTKQHAKHQDTAGGKKRNVLCESVIILWLKLLSLRSCAAWNNMCIIVPGYVLVSKQLKVKLRSITSIFANCY